LDANNAALLSRQPIPGIISLQLSWRARENFRSAFRSLCNWFDIELPAAEKIAAFSVYFLIVSGKKQRRFVFFEARLGAHQGSELRAFDIYLYIGRRRNLSFVQ